MSGQKINVSNLKYEANTRFETIENSVKKIKFNKREKNY